MSRNVFGNIARGAGIVAVLAMSPLAANAANINLAVANTFYGDGVPSAGTSPIADLKAAFEAANPGDTINLVPGQPPTLESNIIGGNTDNIDLFLSADPTQPNDLYNNHRPLVVGMPFNYARGDLGFWSNTSGVDVTCNPGGSCGYNTTTYPNVAIAKNTSLYGAATETLLTGRYGLAAPLSTNPAVTIYSNMDQTYNAIDDGVTKKAGFVPVPRICNTSTGTVPDHGSALIYPPTDTSTSPPTYNYSSIFLASIEIVRSRSSAENTLLANFVAYLQDHTVAPDSQMVTTLKKYCYVVP